MVRTSQRDRYRGPGRFILLPGGQAAIDAAMKTCIAQHGGKVVGNPTILDGFVEEMRSFKGDGKTYSGIWIEDAADPEGWWHEYAMVHGREHIPQ